MYRQYDNVIVARQVNPIVWQICLFVVWAEGKYRLLLTTESAGGIIIIQTRFNKWNTVNILYARKTFTVAHPVRYSSKAVTASSSLHFSNGDIMFVETMVSANRTVRGQNPETFWTLTTVQNISVEQNKHFAEMTGRVLLRQMQRSGTFATVRTVGLEVSVWNLVGYKIV
jgi:hypothetical protein